MKRKNMKVGMKVVVKPDASGYAGSCIGLVRTLVLVDEWQWFIDVKLDGVGVPLAHVYPKEVRKATQEEITAAMLSSMTTQELQQLLDEIDVELDKRLSAVHTDAKYMFRECVVDGHTYYVMGFGDAGSDKPSEHLLIGSHPQGFHGGGGLSFSGDWVGRNDLLWKYKHDVKLVNEDGSLEDVL